MTDGQELRSGAHPIVGQRIWPSPQDMRVETVSQLLLDDTQDPSSHLTGRLLGQACIDGHWVMSERQDPSEHTTGKALEQEVRV